MTKPHYFLGLLTILFCINYSIGQESVVIAGGDLGGSNGSASFSVGQPTFNYHSTSDYSALEGVQQPFEFLVLSIEEEDLNHSFSVFPIPTNNLLNIRINNFDYKNLKLRVVDLQGKVLIHIDVRSLLTQLDLSGLEESIYFLSFIDNGNLLRTQKIIKF